MIILNPQAHHQYIPKTKPTPLPNVSYTDTEIKLENGEYWLSTKLTNIEPGSSVVVAAYDNKGVLISIQIVKSTDLKY